MVLQETKPRALLFSLAGQRAPLFLDLRGHYTTIVDGPERLHPW